MKKILKRGLSFILALMMVVGMLPVTAFAAVDNATGMPKDVNNTLVLAIYTGEGFPGEPAVYGTEKYKNISSEFKVKSGSTFATTANNQLDWAKIQKDIVQGTTSSDTYVWGVYDANGTKDYFLENASIIQPSSEAKIIRAVKTELKNKSDAEVLNQYEIIWYVIKLQHSPGKYFWNSGTTEWHIDGVIKEKKFVSVNYYGNGNTSGNAPLGVTNLTSGAAYTVLDKNTLAKKINGVEVSFLGWSAKADGTGEETGFYQPGDVIYPTQNISLYAMWDTTTQYTATVKTYLDNQLADESDIHGAPRDLYLSTDKEHYYQLTRTGEGVYSTKITGNGKFHLYHKDGDEYIQVGDRQLTIYNQDGTMEVYHYSLTYDTNRGSFEQDPAAEVYYYGNTITATSEIPTKEGYRFLGWENKEGELIQPGEEAVASLTEPVVLTAKWEKTVNVIVNVTINHEGGGGLDKVASKDNVSLALVSRTDANSPYLEVEGKNLKLGEGTVPENQKVTKYPGNTFDNLPGGTTEYTVVASKSHYETKIESTQDSEGNWVIDVVMTYKPTNFDLNFTVKVDENVPEQYLPTAAIVKVTFWSSDRQEWAIITQQADGLPGVRVDIDPKTRTGSGSYPVWMYESDNNPYGNRIQVTSFVYPNGTIVPATEVVTPDVAWADLAYTATLQDVVDGKTYGTLGGAYYDKASDSQKGTLTAVITMDLHDVTFDAQGGTVNGAATQKVEQQYKIPGFANYVPTRGEGYTFGGWYEDKACTIPATEGMDLTRNITLYAKWKEPLTVSGTITVAGTYQQDGATVTVHDIDRAEKVYVVLHELRDDHTYEVASKLLTVVYGDDKNGTVDYSFTQIPDEGKEYQIQLLLLNYDTKYDNESDADTSYSAQEYKAVFNGDSVADVDAYLEFTPPSYDQPMSVDATKIGANLRPTSVLAEIIYRDVGDIHPYQVISQHTVDPWGVPITLSNGLGSGSDSIWKWHTDGTLYEYQMKVIKVGDTEFNSATAPYYISYTEPRYWDANTNAVSGEMKATLIPKNYMVLFNVDAGTDTVTGMEAFELNAEAADTGATHSHATGHTWSYPTQITGAVPVREGYTFKGWKTNVSGVTADLDGNITISENVHERVVLTAQWEQITYNVTTTVDPNEGGTTSGDGTYNYGSAVTVTATAGPGYTFKGWHENGVLVSGETSYTIEDLKADHALVAKFSLNQHEVTTRVYPLEAGTPVGAGTYDYGTEITVSIGEKYGYTFDGWYEDIAINEYGDKVSDALSFDVKVTEDLRYVAKFLLNEYTVTTAVSPDRGGTTSGDGNYKYKDYATVEAIAEAGYAFVGWYENGVEVSKEDKYTFLVEGDRDLEARFEAIMYQVTTEASPEDGGTVEGTASYHYNETATVKATAAKYFTFGGWYQGDKLVSSDLVYSFPVTSDVTLTAVFTKGTYTVTVIHNEGCNCTECTNKYVEVHESGKEITVTVTPKDGYKFLGWFEGEGESASVVWEDTSYTFVVESNRTLTAKFACVYTITAIAETGGSVSGGGQYEPMTNATITATADGGYYFVGWYNEKDELVTADTSYSLTVKKDRTFTAKFEKKVNYKCDYVYLFGYNDTQIGAEGPLLRGELAQMIYRLVKQNTGAGNGGISFNDTTGEWFASGISYMASKGAIDRNQQKAYPLASVNRGETYKMICLGLGFTTDNSLDLSDYAAILRNSGYLTGDGAVTAKIKRYEFCALFNAILGRSNYALVDANGNEITAKTYGYTDLDSSADYYRTMMIATSAFTDGKVDIAKRVQRNTYDYNN